MKLFALTLLVSLSAFGQKNPRAGSQDHYANFSELAAKNVEGTDYEIVIKNNKSNILVMSFHGGFIEPGTTELGEAVSSDKFDFYTFKALKNDETDGPSATSSLLHLTSAHFDEPHLMKLTTTADFCLGLHGFGGREADFCVGGGNSEQRKILVQKFSKAFPDLKTCELCCDPFNGVSAKNPINKCKLQGVQVEMSPKVRKKILRDGDFLKLVSKEFRDFLSSNAPTAP
jgi:phage replication-related protein YjqB (UPF0714/DUF867 family)